MTFPLQISEFHHAGIHTQPATPKLLRATEGQKAIHSLKRLAYIKCHLQQSHTTCMGAGVL